MAPSVSLQFRGGRLHIQGSPAATRWLLFLARDNFHEDDAVLRQFDRYFVDRGWAVAHYEASLTQTRRLMADLSAAPLPPPWKFLRKTLRLLAHPTRWPHAIPWYRHRLESIAFRARLLGRVIRRMGTDRSVFLVTRSASGRVASLIADELPVKAIVCLGYPFQNPECGPEPARYTHLASVRTPLLILQGTHDPYGGRDIEGQYALSPSVQLEWVETDHDYRLTPEAWNAVLARIETFLGSIAITAGVTNSPRNARPGIGAESSTTRAGSEIL